MIDPTDAGCVRTSSGRMVVLTAAHIQGFARSYSVGDPAHIRKEGLARLRGEVQRVFPGTTGICVTACEGPPDDFPALVVMCEFLCAEPVAGDADYSTLIVVWFANDWNWSISEFVAAKMPGVDWEQHAEDGWY